MAEDDNKGGGNNINFGGGVNIGGNFVGGDQNISGDKVQGDKVGGDKVSIGSVDKSNVQIGDGNTMHVGDVTLNQAFHEIREEVMEKVDMPEEQQPVLDQTVAELQEMDEVEAEPSVDKVDQVLSVLEDIAPDAVEVIINAITNPGAAVGSGLKLAIQAWRKARQISGGNSD